jgi:protein-tyrosine phosphatase
MVKIMSENKIKILFVCFGITCRSPMAEAIFQDLIAKRVLDSHFLIDSAGLVKKEKSYL